MTECELKLQQMQVEVDAAKSCMQRVQSEKLIDVKQIDDLKLETAKLQIEARMNCEKLEQQIQRLHLALADMTQQKQEQMKKVDELFRQNMRFQDVINYQKLDIERLEYKKQQQAIQQEKEMKRFLQDQALRTELMEQQWKAKNLALVRQLEDKRITDIQKQQFKNQEKIREVETFHQKQVTGGRMRVNAGECGRVNAGECG